MKLSYLTISKMYGKPGYDGSVIFQGPMGEVKLKLNETLSEAVMEVVSSELVRASKTLAEHLTKSIEEESEKNLLITSETPVAEANAAIEGANVADDNIDYNLE